MERKQYVSLSGETSSYQNIKHGVTQGSVLGPILFLIYINDLARAIIYSKLYNFADDTAILYSDQPQTLKEKNKYRFETSSTMAKSVQNPT